MKRWLYKGEVVEGEVGELEIEMQVKDELGTTVLGELGVEKVEVEFAERDEIAKDRLEVVETGKEKLFEEEMGIAMVIGMLLRDEVGVEKTVEAEDDDELVKPDKIAGVVEVGGEEIQVMSVGKQG